MRMPKLPRPGGILAAYLLTLVGLVGCSTHDPVARGHVSAFGSPIEITLIGINRRHAAEVTRTLERDFELMEEAWHAWEEGPVSRMNMLFNQDNTPFAAPPSVLPLLKLSKSIAEQSDHLFNPAIGHLVRAWGFQGRPAECLRPPPKDLIDIVVEAAPTMNDIHIDGFRVWSDNDIVKLDFRAIQRGYAIDQAILRLQELGINNASISANGNVHAIGSRDGHPWSVTVRAPDGGGVFATLKIIGNEAAFTTGEYQTYFTWDGELYHDIIDPRTGYPATGTSSVTVLHPNASTANAAATALFVAGPKDWHRLARQMGIRYVMLTDSEGRVHMNPAMKTRIKLHRDNREIIISEPLT